MNGRIQAPPGMSLHVIGTSENKMAYNIDEYKSNLGKQDVNSEEMNFNLQYPNGRFQNFNTSDYGISGIQEKVRNLALEPTPITNFEGFLEDDDDELPPPPPPVLSTLNGHSSSNLNLNLQVHSNNQQNLQFQETMQYLPSGQQALSNILHETDTSQVVINESLVTPAVQAPALAGSFSGRLEKKNLNDTVLENLENSTNTVESEVQSGNTNQASNLLLEIQTGIKLKV